MNTPKSVQVGQTEYRIELDPTEIDSDTCGSTYLTQSVIRIRPGLSEGEHRDTLLHETLHACAHFANISHKERLVEEEWIGRLTPVLLDTLCRNPELRKVLFNEA